MNQIDVHFGRPRVLLVVIHIASRMDAIHSMRIAESAGADGIFCIPQGGPEEMAIELATYARLNMPSLWVGLNLLSGDPIRDLTAIPSWTNGLWVDNANVREDLGLEDQDSLRAFNKLEERMGWPGLYFAGVACWTASSGCERCTGG